MKPPESSRLAPPARGPLASVVAVATNSLGGAALGFFAWVLVGILGSKVAPDLAPLLRGHLFAPWMAIWCVPFIGLFAAAFGGTCSPARAGLAAVAVAVLAGGLAAALGHALGVVIGVTAGGLVGAALVAVLTVPGLELRLRRKPVRRAALLIGGLWLIAVLVGAAVVSYRVEVVSCRVEAKEPSSTGQRCDCSGQEAALPQDDERRKRGIETVCIAEPKTTRCYSTGASTAASTEVPCRP